MKAKTCKHCKGTGKVPQSLDSIDPFADDRRPQLVRCRWCNGTGKLRTCRSCGCTNSAACVRVRNAAELLDAAGPLTQVECCSWVEDDLCSACTPDAAENWQHSRDWDRVRLQQQLRELATRN